MNESKSYKLADGSILTDETIDKWCESYEKGNFPEGEHTVSGIVYGRPIHPSQTTTVFSIEIPSSLEKAIKLEAEKKGMSESSFAIEALMDKLASV